MASSLTSYRVWLLATIALVALLLWFVLPYILGLMKFEVVNSTSIPIDGVEIQVNGINRRIGKLDPGAAKSITCTWLGDPSPTVYFVDSTGQPRSEDIELFMEDSFKGQVSIQLIPNGTITVDPDISIAPWQKYFHHEYQMF